MEISIPIKYEIIDFIGAEKTREETTVDVVKKYKEIETTLLFSKKEHYYIVYKEDPYSRCTQEVDSNVYNNTKIGKIAAEKTIYKLRNGTTTTMVRVKDLGNISFISKILDLVLY